MMASVGRCRCAKTCTSILSMFWMRLWTPTPGMAIRKSPMMKGREDCIGRELWAWLVAWERVWQRGRADWASKADLTQIDRSHEALREKRCL